ncbi:MAG: hypothetical protein ACTH1D_09640 [Mycobacteriaceae bacterium]|uniref:hypothetical protein n=1 Tax=Corynebacterium sp. TaxID=1720 RepID=UPI003F993448
MSDSLRYLQELQRSLAIALPVRVLFSVVFGVIVGLISSPIAQPWMPFALIGVMFLLVIPATIRIRTRGLNHNDYAPMKPDSETDGRTVGPFPSLQGRTAPQQQQRLLILTVATVVLGPQIGDAIDPAFAGWTWAALITLITLASTWRILVIDAAAPVGYVPLRDVFATEPGWTPADDADAVASTLYAMQAVPAGRQVRLDVLLDSVTPLGLDGEQVKAGIDTLTAQSLAVVIRDRRDRDTVLKWVTLTEEGSEAVQRGVGSAVRG